MIIHRNLSDPPLNASVCAIGMFDGVHTGHALVLENALREARIRQLPSVVVSFADHPQILTAQTPTPLLSSLEERLDRFASLGFDHALILTFDATLKNQSAEAFIQTVLLEHLGIRSVTVGYDHRFGKDRRGDGDLLKRTGQRHGFDVQIIEPVRILIPGVNAETSTNGGPMVSGGQIVSSTLIRKLLSYGDMTQANHLLGYPYALTGLVETGAQRGRDLGFPTANLSVGARRLIPGSGVYAGFARLMPRQLPGFPTPDRQPASEPPSLRDTWPAVCNIGLSPTFGDQLEKRVEVHLLDYGGPAFYGERLQMTFGQRIRDERKFTSVDALISQIRQDCQTARLYADCQSTVAEPPSPLEAFQPAVGKR
jgi:riboflavin kinase/FMN adenylyltransferase